MANISAPKLPVKGDDDFAIFELGVEEGKLATRMAVLGYLEEKYMDDSVERGSSEAQDLLAIARDLSQFIKDLANGEKLLGSNGIQT